MGIGIDKPAQFNAWDANQDGKWSREEADYVIYERNQALILEGNGFEGIDKNVDGGIDANEYKNSNLKIFLEEAGTGSAYEDIDTDKDNYIMPKEYIKVVEKASKRKMDLIFSQADTNHDQFISEAEFTQSGALVNSVCVFPCEEGEL